MNRRIYPRPRRDTRGLFSSPEIRPLQAPSPPFCSRALSPRVSPAPILSFAVDDRNYIRSRPAASKYVPRSERDERQKRFPCYNPRLWKRNKAMKEIKVDFSGTGNAANEGEKRGRVPTVSEIRPLLRKYNSGRGGREGRSNPCWARFARRSKLFRLGATLVIPWPDCCNKGSWLTQYTCHGKYVDKGWYWGFWTAFYQKLIICIFNLCRVHR